MIIAHRFIGGDEDKFVFSPVGTTDMCDNFSRPYGTLILLHSFPTDESVGYFQMLLRSKESDVEFHI